MTGQSVEISVRISLLQFMSIAAQRLDSALVRKEIGPLVSIHVWTALSSTKKRESIIDEYPALKKMWKSSQKRLQKGTPELVMSSGWLFSMVVDFLRGLYSTGTKQPVNELYANRFVEFLIVLLSQLPTRRFTNTLLSDLNLIAIIKLSSLFATNTLFAQLTDILSYYMHFPLNDFTGQYLSEEEYRKQVSQDLLIMREKAFDAFPEQLKLMTFANLASLSNRDNLKDHLNGLDNDEFMEFCSILGVRTKYPVDNIPTDRNSLTEYFIERYAKRPTLQETVDASECLPTEKSLFADLFEATIEYQGATPLALHKMSLQYLSVQDFLVRAFQLSRAEAFFQIRADVETILTRLKPEIVTGFTQDADGDEVPTKELKLNGFSRMASKLGNPLAILEVTPSKVGSVGKVPGTVKAEIALDYQYSKKAQDWDSLRKDEVVFIAELMTPSPGSAKLHERLGMRHLRSAQVVQVLDAHDRPVQYAEENEGDEGRGQRARKIHVLLDPYQYAHDPEGVYKGLNVVIRRRQRENNFNSILQTIKSLVVDTSDEIVLPEWLSDVFLGFGDPTAASYGRVQDLISDFPETIDYNDTFLDYNHLQESFKEVEVEGKPSPPFVLPGLIDQETDKVKATSYRPINRGPYASDQPLKNKIRYTPRQILSIVSGTTPGLTLVEGPPGTGKTDVAVQILSNIYHNFPEERTLVIAHSNQALNHIFEKIVGLDIDDKHLLRLGHGEEKLKKEVTGGESFSRYGRVDQFLQSRDGLLAEVDRLANSIGVYGAYGDSCDTANAFFTVYVKPMWEAYQSRGGDSEEDFPFTEYFSNTSLFSRKSEGSESDDIKYAAEGAFRHIEKLFNDLAAIRPYELIKSNREKANYMLVKDARIIAMTATHAGMNRAEILKLGFHYDNVVMEEAAQLTEIESFIPLTMQNSLQHHQHQSKQRLRRVVLIGDDKQNAPIIQNAGLRQYGGMDQSLFSRLSRLGVPVIELDFQGRARPEIADLYGWQYSAGLKHLPNVVQQEGHNAGFLYNFQFINVGVNNHQQGKGGETEPSAHFIQNLEEAEYAVALYQYMRLLGYPRERITILSAYMGQKKLIEEIIQERCTSSSILRRVFGAPSSVSTVDQYQGEQNDYMIVSLVRTKSIGYLRDIRRMTVALSRGRLGLYVLGCQELIGTCLELEPIWRRLDRSAELEEEEDGANDLQVVPGEMYNAGSGGGEVSEPRQGTRMQGLEHFGQYVYEMSQTRIEYEQRES